MSGPRHARARTHRSWPQRLVIVLGVVLTLTFASTAGGVGYLYWRLGDVRVFDDVTVDAVDHPTQPRNYLVVGSDLRSEGDGDFGQTVGERADTIMVVRFDPTTHQAYLLSLPRDLWVELPDGDHNRINAAYGRGRQALIDTIRHNFGIDVHHYVEVNFRAFEQVVATIGGVNMFFPTPMRDRESGLDVPEPGCVLLDGGQALAFARARHLEYRTDEGWETDPTGDLGRISRQQVFVRRVVAQALTRNLFNPVTLNGLLDATLSNVGLDPVLGQRDTLLGLADELDGFTLDNLHSYSIPAIGFRTSGGAAVLRIDDARARPIFNIFRGVSPDSFVASDITVSVLNGSGVPGQAGAVRDALGVVGFMTGRPATADGDYARTTIYYHPDWAGSADLLARHLTSGADLVPDPSLGPAELVLVTGTDFTTVMDRPAADLPTTTTAPTGSSSSTSDPVATTTTTALPAAPPTSTTVIGIVPGDPPPGVACG
jgi:LCP family protein required for cell wall assembly